MSTKFDLEADEELMTSEQILDRLQVEPALRSFALTCVLPAVRRGEDLRFRRRDLETWITRELTALAERNRAS
jgi:hypothetical protein